MQNQVVDEMIEQEKDKLDLLASAVGLRNSLKLCAHFGCKTLYIPTHIEPNHPIALLVGEKKAKNLSLALGGEEVTLPMLDMSVERRVARVIRFLVHGFSPREISGIEGISTRTVNRIALKYQDMIALFKSNQHWQAVLNLPVPKKG